MNSLLTFGFSARAAELSGASNSSRALTAPPIFFLTLSANAACERDRVERSPWDSCRMPERPPQND